MQSTNNTKSITNGGNAVKQFANIRKNTRKERKNNETKTKIIVTEYYGGVKSLKEKLLGIMLKEISETNNEQK